MLYWLAFWKMDKKLLLNLGDVIINLMNKINLNNLFLIRLYSIQSFIDKEIFADFFIEILQKRF